jgi:hypothetical protein
MAKEEAKEEVETSPEEPKEPQKEQPSEEEPVSEDAKTPPESDKGDLNIALKEERTKRQELERKLQDPNFVYSKAEELGLTRPEADAQAESPTDQAQAPRPAPNIFPLMQDFYAYKEAVKEFPEAESNPDVADMVNGMVQSGKKTPAEAVKAVKKELEKQAEKLKSEESKKQEEEETKQEKAQTAGIEHDTSSDTEEMADLLKRSKSLNPTVQKPAMIELLKRKNKEAGLT